MSRTPSIPETFAAYGWEVTPEWVEKYNTDPWVYNLTNALVTLWTVWSDAQDEAAPFGSPIPPADADG